LLLAADRRAETIDKMLEDKKTPLSKEDRAAALDVRAKAGSYSADQ
jgi:hypothetical protein